MKKLLLILTLMFALVSCQCSGNGEPTLNDNEKLGGIQVENIIKTDFETMLAKYGDADFRWYECDILLNDFLDEENDGTIAELVNIYQTVINKDSTSFDTQVYKVQHFPNGKVFTDSIRGFWIENYPIHLDELKVTYDSAYALVMAVNLPKPHSQHVTLRNPIGPKGINPQWIFGNTHSQIWVDATTGEIHESNPAFPDDYLTRGPLGEWP
jgi:hypothetical protein